ncbi:MAG: LysR family transcriptional regulator [Acidimicrobiales bacterium]
MELRQLRYFVEVVRAGSYAAAAQRLHVAQPGVWKQVRALERELGVSLFERVGRRVRLTPDGELVLAQADNALAGVTRVADLAGDLRAGRAGTVTVGCVSAHIAGFLSRAVASHRRQHPDVHVRLVEVDLTGATTAGADPFAAALTTGAVDVVTSSTRLVGFDSFPIYEVHVVAVVPPRHPWRSRREIHVRDLAASPIVTTPRGYFSRSMLDRACRLAGVEPRIVMESGSPVALLALGRDGIGIPVVASDAVPEATRSLPELVDDGGPLREVVALYARPEAARSAAVNTFVESARRLAASHTS